MDSTLITLISVSNVALVRGSRKSQLQEGRVKKGDCLVHLQVNSRNHIKQLKITGWNGSGWGACHIGKDAFRVIENCSRYHL